MALFMKIKLHEPRNIHRVVGIYYYVRYICVAEILKTLTPMARVVNACAHARKYNI